MSAQCACGPFTVKLMQPRPGTKQVCSRGPHLATADSRAGIYEPHGFWLALMGVLRWGRLLMGHLCQS